VYRPGKLTRQGPKLLKGACTTHVLVPLASRHLGRVLSNQVHVERYVEGWVLIDLPWLDPSGSWLRVLVEGSVDTQRWADVMEARYYLPGYYRLPVSNLGAYVRVACEIGGVVQCGVEFLGKSFQVGVGG
jgi:hypothetical protein